MYEYSSTFLATIGSNLIANDQTLTSVGVPIVDLLLIGNS